MTKTYLGLIVVFLFTFPGCSGEQEGDSDGSPDTDSDIDTDTDSDMDTDTDADTDTDTDTNIDTDTHPDTETGTDEDSGMDTNSDTEQPVWNFNTLIWSDEFDGVGPPDSSKWEHENLGPLSVNNELQQYTDALENSYQAGGSLFIEALNNMWSQNPSWGYTSARLISRGLFEFSYGRVEARAKVAGGVGSWPAIWMLGYNIGDVGWPACGEIDIMEYVGYNPTQVHGSAHAPNYNFQSGEQQTGIYDITTAETGFHNYAIEWFEDHIDYFVDGNKYLTAVPMGGDIYDNNAWPFSKDHFLILNVAVGGGWGGQAWDPADQIIDDAAFPMVMEIDYVRVYQ